MRITLLSTALIAGSACTTMAPSSYELNRRSGLAIGPDSGEAVEMPAILFKSESGVGELPQRLPPRLEKVWVFDQAVNDNAWLYGTWVVLEVEQARWEDQHQ